MMSANLCKTIEEGSSSVYKDKNSKFFGFSYHVVDVGEVKNIVSALRKEYYDARHCCYAYRIGIGGEIYRANDDGEPSGVAGKPIYNLLLSYDATNVLVVVVRYFGGVLLGVSGLIKAYKTAARSVLASSKWIPFKPMVELEICFPEQTKNGVIQYCKKKGLNFSAIEFINTEYNLKVNIPSSSISEFSQAISDIEMVRILTPNILNHES